MQSRPAPGFYDRLHLLAHNRVSAGLLLGEAIVEGKNLDDLVIVIADTTDQVGGHLARALASLHPGLHVDRERDRVLRRGEIPTAVATIPVAVAVALLGPTDPTVAKGLVIVTPPGRTRVVLVGGGGATLVHAAVESLKPSGKG